MTVTVIPIFTGVLGIVTKRFVQGLVDWEIRIQLEFIQTTALLRLARVLGDLRRLVV